MLSFKWCVTLILNSKLLVQPETIFELCCISVALATPQIAYASKNLYT
jgi:hypothetical protein